MIPFHPNWQGIAGSACGGAGSGDGGGARGREEAGISSRCSTSSPTLSAPFYKACKTEKYDAAVIDPVTEEAAAAGREWGFPQVAPCPRELSRLHLQGLQAWGKDGDPSKKFWSTKDAAQESFAFHIGLGSVIKGLISYIKPW